MKHPKKRTDVSVRIVDGETVVLDRRHGLIHQLNQTASFIWERCDGDFTGNEIASQLVEAFDLDVYTAVIDVRNVVEQLRALKLLEP
jgi:hypothetical protein